MTSNVSIKYNGGLLPDIILLTRCYPILLCLMGYYIASVFPFLVSFSPTSYCFDPMLCPAPRHYTVDPMLLPSGNPGKNAMERFRSVAGFVFAAFYPT